MKILIRPTFRMWVVLAVLGLWAGPASAESPERILFIGNSYSAQIKSMLTKTVAASSGNAKTLEFITRGGATLTQHWENLETRNRIKEGDWDVVVLQDQSQVPALGGEHSHAFEKAVKAFSKLIHDSGGKPMLYMTWGRRDGDAKNAKVFPDYETMQKKLTRAYEQAAKKHQCQLAPVGKAWAELREMDPELGQALYKKDGSHPSTQGAYLVSCVFLRTLFNSNLSRLPTMEGVSSAEELSIHKAVMAAE